MAKASVARKATASNAPAVARKVNQVEHAAAIWAAVSRLADKQQNRDELNPGSYRVKLSLSAVVDDGPVYRQTVEGDLSVAEDTQSAPSHFPGGESLLLAVALSKVNEQTRAALLRDVLAAYSAGELPEVSAGELEEVKNFCKQIRALHKQPKRGNVSFAGQPAQPPLSLID